MIAPRRWSARRCLMIHSTSFGGSAIVVFGEPGAWRPAEDLLTHTQENVETLVRLGDVIGRSTRS